MTYELTENDLAVVESASSGVLDPDDLPAIIDLHRRALIGLNADRVGLLRSLAGIERSVALRTAVLARLERRLAEPAGSHVH